MGLSCLSYGGKKIVPAPLVSINKTYNNTADGQHLGVTYDLQLIGTLVPFLGSPSGNYSDINNAFFTSVGDPPDQDFESPPGDFNSLLRKQEAIRHLFKNDGLELSWEPAGSVAVRCNPRVNSISFSQGTWTQRVDYTIDLSADNIIINGIGTEDESLPASGSIKSATEEWDFQDVPGHIGSGFNVTHTVTAQGIASYEGAGSLISAKQPWENAKDFVDLRTVGTIDTTIMFAVLGVNNWLGGKYTKSTNANETDGGYSTTESWLLMPTNDFTEQNFSFDTSNGPDTPTVVYNGTIFGISNNERAGGALAVANARAAIPSNAEARTDAIDNLGSLLGSLIIPDIPAVKNIGIDNTQGTVSFSFTWEVGSSSTSTKTQEASLSFDANTGLYSLSFTCDIRGFGDTASDRVTNAKAAILTDSAARTAALDIIGDQIPAGVTINTDHNAKATSINNNTGVIRVSWTWDSTDANNVVITVDTDFSSEVVAEIAVPGRDIGPIIQDMSTVTPQRLSVNYEGQFDSEPDDTTVANTMDAALSISVSTTHVVSDQKSFSPTTGRYRRSRNYLVKN